MKITYRLNVEDWVNFQEYYRKKSAPLYSCLTPVIITIIILNIILGTYFYFVQGPTTYTWVGAVCVAILLYLIYLNSKTKSRLTKAGMDLEKKNPDIFGPMTMNMDEKGIDFQSQNNTKFLPWEEIDKYDSNKEYYFIYSKKGVAYIIPKRNIQESATEMENMLDKYYNDSIKTNT